MKTRYQLAIILLLSGLTGCIPFLNPLYTDKDLVIKKELIGTWVVDDENETWTFEEVDGKYYKLTYVEGRKKAELKAYLVKLDKFYFLDMYPVEDTAKNQLYNMHFIPAHTISKIEINSEQVELRMFDYSWLEKGLDNKQVKVTHVKSQDGGILVTASTKELQKFVVKYAIDKKALADSHVLKRKG